MRIEVLSEILKNGVLYSNPGLAFYKLHTLSSKETFINNPNKEGIKKDYLESLIKRLDERSISEAVERVRRLTEDIEEKFVCKKLSAKVGYRLVVGMGYPSFVENGLLFHHTYGIPYIHGESIKGLTRHMYTESKGEDDRCAELFGTQEREGKLIFFDAFPLDFKPENLTVDIMNPHYQEYYQDSSKKPPADWYNPIPIFFLTVEEVEFTFLIGYDPLRVNKKKGDELLEEAVELLKKGLETYGLGGKRRKGYGWFDIP
jgi:CRISPR-associated protein Cmr6